MKKLLSSLILSVFIFCFFLNSQAHAKKKNYLEKYHNDFGIELFEQKKYDQAIEQFAKVLMLDTGDKIAADHLKKIGKDRQYWPSGYHLQLLRYVELSEYTEFLKNRIKFLHSNNKMLLDFVLSRADFNKDIISEARDIRENIKKNLVIPSGGSLNIENDQFNTPVDLTKYIEIVTQDREQLLNELSELQALNRQLRTIKRDVVAYISENRKETRVKQMAKQFDIIETRIEAKDEVIKQQEANYESVARELSQVQSEFAQLTKNMSTTEIKLEGMTKEIANLSLEVYEKNRLVAEKDSRISMMEKELIESRERMNLVQRIIQEKDEHIQLLEEEIIALQVDYSADDALAGKAMETLQKEARDSLAKLKKMQEQFTEMTDRYSDVDKLINQRDTAIIQLNADLAKKDNIIANYKKIFLTKDRKLTEMNGVVEIYKSKLQDTAVDLEDKNEKLNNLEMQMDELDMRLEGVRILENDFLREELDQLVKKHLLKK